MKKKNKNNFYKIFSNIFLNSPGFIPGWIGSKKLTVIFPGYFKNLFLPQYLPEFNFIGITFIFKCLYRITIPDWILFVELGKVLVPWGKINTGLFLLIAFELPINLLVIPP